MPSHPPARVLIATTAMLTFISFWRASAVVLNDMGSSAFYAGAIAEHFVGRTAPWFILAIMLLAYAVRAVYIESCGMFVRGGVYRVVKEAMGRTLAKFSVSALMFDYILTGPISGVSAGLYVTGLVNELLAAAHSRVALPMNQTAAAFAVFATLFFWRENIKGIRESSGKALRIMQVTTIMVVLLLAWSALTIALRGAHVPPLPHLATLDYSHDALGWLGGTSLPYTVTLIAILVGLGHSVLAMSGEETMAQVYREIEHPKLRNLKRAGLVIFLYSLVFTAGSAFLVVMLVPDTVRASFSDNPIGGLAMFLAGPLPLRLTFRGFVAVVGTLMLAGAVNTSIVGSGGVLSRVSEDGILPQWFRRPHRRFGTAYRILNLVAALQIATILLSRGNIFVLGEAYAFGVMWSFALKSLAVLVLRYRQPGSREFRVPLNVRVRGVELPLGLASITVVLFSLCIVNLFTKQVATLSGAACTLMFFAVFSWTERAAGRRPLERPGLDQFNLASTDGLTAPALGVRPASVLVPIRNYRTLDNLRGVLETVDTRQHDIVALHLRFVGDAGTGEYGLRAAQLFGEDEQHLFTRALEVAEKAGKPIHLAVAAATNRWDAILRAAQGLESSAIVLGASPTSPVTEEARLAGLAWEQLPSPRPKLTLRIVFPSGEDHVFFLGPHTPELAGSDVGLLHAVWLDLSGEVAPLELHHRDVVRFALEDLQRELATRQRSKILDRVRRGISRQAEENPAQ